MITIPLYSLAKTAYEDFLAQGLNRYCRSIDAGFFEEIVKAGLEDELSFRMKWATASYQLDTLIEQLDAEDWWELQLRGIIDRCIISPMDDLLGQVIDWPTWQVWDTSWLGCDVTMEKRGDYRILEWERLSGEYEPHRFPFLKTCTSPAKLIFLPVRSMARSVWSYWFKHKKSEKELTVELFEEIAIQIIEDRLTERMVWASNTTNVESFLLANDLYANYLSSGAFNSAVMRLGFRIESCLDGLISDHTWEIWQVRKLDLHGVVKLERGKDYRIWDYPRMREMELNAQKWKRPAAAIGYSIEADSGPG